MKLYQRLAGLILRKDNDLLEGFAHRHLPSGSGIDSGCKVDLERSTANRIVINFGYHHMNENGYYDGWTHHDLIIKPDLQHDFTLRITGPDRNQTKEYLYELFYHCLNQEIEL